VETYRVIAPFWVGSDFLLTDYDPCALPEPTYTLEIVPREEESRVCYNTVEANTIEQFSTRGSTVDNVEGFQVQFLGRDNFIISHRYSILVRQYVQSPEAYAYYEALRQFSGSESLFSQVQPGELPANVSRDDGTQEEILGWVEAVSVSEQRLFFNYDDLFPGEELPEYPFNCRLLSVPESHVSYCAFDTRDESCPQSVIESVDQGLISYYAPYDENLVPVSSCPGPHVHTPIICGDCRLLGSNEVPEFWIEE